MSAENLESKKILLVCSRDCTRVEEHLLHGGYRVTKVDEGTAAIERAKHESFNAAVLISTGTEMDLAETVLNLRDVNPGVEIIIVAGSDNAEEKAAQTAALVRALPETNVLTISDLDHYLAAFALKGRPVH
jgi:DNA-binding response OmpR family regulator